MRNRLTTNELPLEDLETLGTTLDWAHDPTDPDNYTPNAEKRFVHTVCHPFSHHDGLAERFAAAGFKVVRVQKEWCFDLWSIVMERGDSGLPRDYQPAIRRLRRILETHCVPVDRDSPTLRSNGNRVSIAFRWCEGEVGAICRRRGGGWNAVRSPTYKEEHSDHIPE